MTSNASRLLDGPIAPTLARFALPLLVTNFLHALTATWGALWVGQVLGPNALPAVVTANVIVFMVMGTAMGIGTAAAVAVGQSLGAGDVRAVKRVVGSAIAFVLGFGALVGGIGWMLTPDVVQAMGTPVESRGFAITHLRLVCLAMPGVFTFMVMMMLLRATGDTRTPFRFMLLWIGLNLLLGPLLLTGSLGLPRLGMAGLGLAGLLANGCALLSLVAYSHARQLPIALHGADLRHLRPDPALVRLLVRRGLPLAVESVVVQGAYFVLLGAVNSFGATTAAAYAAAAQLWSFVQLPSNSLAAAMSAMAAINIGAGRWDRVALIARRGCALSLVISAGATAILYALGDAPLRLFIPLGGAALDKAWQINLIVLWGWIALAATVGLFAIMRANGDMLAPMLIFAATMWVCRVPIALALQPWLGEAAIWWSFPAGAITSALAALAWYRWGGWRNKPLLLDSVQAPAEETHIGE